MSIDVLVENHGSIFIVLPLSSEAREWVREHVPERTNWGRGFVVEPRYLDDLLQGMTADGLAVGPNQTVDIDFRPSGFKAASLKSRSRA